MKELTDSYIKDVFEGMVREDYLIEDEMFKLLDDEIYALREKLGVLSTDECFLISEKINEQLSIVEERAFIHGVKSGIRLILAAYYDADKKKLATDEP